MDCYRAVEGAATDTCVSQREAEAGQGLQRKVRQGAASRVFRRCSTR